jgi:hypothetical protein
MSGWRERVCLGRAMHAEIMVTAGRPIKLFMLFGQPWIDEQLRTAALINN